MAKMRGRGGGSFGEDGGGGRTSAGRVALHTCILVSSTLPKAFDFLSIAALPIAVLSLLLE